MFCLLQYLYNYSFCWFYSWWSIAASRVIFSSAFTHNLLNCKVITELSWTRLLPHYARRPADDGCVDKMPPYSARNKVYLESLSFLRSLLMYLIANLNSLRRSRPFKSLGKNSQRDSTSKNPMHPRPHLERTRRRSRKQRPHHEEK